MGEADEPKKAVLGRAGGDAMVVDTMVDAWMCVGAAAVFDRWVPCWAR
jgi:hypothetical protein